MITTVGFNSASSIESEIFVLDKSNNTQDVKENLKDFIEPSAEAGVFQFSDSQQECRTADIHAEHLHTAWSREAMWPI